MIKRGNLIFLLISLSISFLLCMNIAVATPEQVKNWGTYRTWEDGTFAPTCTAYRYPYDSHSYSGDIGDGIYTISPDGITANAFNVTCNMTIDGGGWTVLIYTNATGNNNYSLDPAYPSSTFACGSNSVSCTLGYTRINAIINNSQGAILRAHSFTNNVKFYWKRNDSNDRWEVRDKRNATTELEEDQYVGWMMRDHYTGLNANNSDINLSTYSNTKTNGGWSTGHYGPWAWPDGVNNLILSKTNNGFYSAGDDKAGTLMVKTVVNYSSSSAPIVNFTSPTPANNTVQSEKFVLINATIMEQDLKIITYTWNGSNYTLYNDSLVLMMNFDNVSALNECTVRNQAGCIKDFSKYGNNGTIGDGTAGSDPTWNSSGKYSGAYYFDGVNDYLNISNSPSINITSSITVAAWIKASSWTAQSWQGTIIGKDEWSGAGSFSKGYVLRAGNSAGNGQLSFTVGTSGSSLWREALTPQLMSLNTWYYVVGTFNGSHTLAYINGVLQGSNSTAYTLMGASEYPLTIGVSPFDTTRKFNGHIDEVMIWNRSLNSSEIYQLYVSNVNKFNSSQWNIYINQSKNSTDELNYSRYTYQVFGTDSTQTGSSEQRTITISPSINLTFNNQVPADLNVGNFVGPEGLNISYNISTPYLNYSTVLLYYKSNSTTNDIVYYENGTAYSGYLQRPFTVNNSGTFTWRLYDNQILPASYNIDERTLETTIHNSSSMTSNNNFISIEILNVSNNTRYNYFEFMANRSSGTGDLRVIYCNSSFNFASNPATSNNCYQFYALTNNIYNHSHSNYSKHMAVPFPINGTTGKIGTVKVTPVSYFILRGRNGNTWRYYYINNTARINATRYSTSGTSFISQNYTVDSHLHQFGINHSFWYYVCANNTFNYMNCSIPRQDDMEYAGLPPSSPYIITPENITYTGNININYTAAESPNNYRILFYNISLLNQDFTFNRTIISNNSLNLTYDWNSNITPDGNYFIKVEACDELMQCSSGYSENFTIYNNIPRVNISLIYPISNINATKNIFFNVTVNVSCMYADCGDINVSLDPETKVVYNATGSLQTFIVPEGVTSLNVKVWGAGGGGSNYSTSYQGGSGGFANGTISVYPGQVLSIVVGTGGLRGNSHYNSAGLGGYGGGGNGTNGDATGGGGGGLSGIFNGTFTQTNSILIAGGGGGGTGYSAAGGAGGGVVGSKGGSAGGCGGTQASGGSCLTYGTNGAALRGGNGDSRGNLTGSASLDGGGGGGGYYGGEGGESDATPGGGGSGYNSSILVSNSSLIAGNNGTGPGRSLPPMTSDSDYISGVGLGGNSSTVTGMGGNGSIIISYSASAKGLVSTIAGATPFYTNQSNPRTINLNASQSELVTFWVNATGTANSTYQFFAYANITSNSSLNNRTTIFNVTIVNQTSVDTIPPMINFTSPTPENNTNTSNRFVEINVSIYEQNISSLSYNWNSTNYNLYDNSLILGYNFNNNSALGENSTRVADYSLSRNNGTISGATLNYSGRYASSYYFDGNDVISANGSSLSGVTSFSFSLWVKPMGSLADWKGILSKYVDDNHCIALQTRTGGGIALDIDNTASGSNFATNTSVLLSIGTWTHLVVAYNGSGSTNADKLKAYANGIPLVLSFTGNVASVTNINSAPIYIGEMEAGTYFTGFIDEVRIFNRTLSQNEAYLEYVSNLQKFNSSQWYLYVNQSKNSTSGLDYGTYTYQAFASDSSGNSNSTDQRTIILQSSIPTISALILNSTNGTNTTSENLTAYATVTPLTAKVFYNWYRNGSAVTVFNMPFDGGALASGGKIRDYAMGNNGTITSPPVYNSTGGIDGKGAYWFNGTGAYISTNLNYSSVSLNHTVSFWMKTTQNSGQTFFSFGSAYGITYSSGGWYIPNTTGAWVCPMTGSGNFFDGNWHFFTLIKTGNSFALYKDGSSAYSIANCQIPNSNLGLDIGWDHTTNWRTNGSIDEFIIWNRSLSGLEVSALYYSYMQNNSNNKIVSAELINGDNWTVSATPNDNNQDGSTTISNNIIIGNPSNTDLVAPRIDIISATQSSGALQINVSIMESNLSSATYNWNGTYYTFYDPNLLIMYNFDNISEIGETASKAVDVSKYRNNGTMTGTTWNSSGKFNGAMRFGSLNNRVVATNQIDLTNAGTLSAWVYAYSFPSSNPRIIGSVGNVPVGLLADNSYGPYNNLSLYVSGRIVDSPYSLTTGRWIFVAGTFNSSGVNIYVNGTRVYSDSTPSTGGSFTPQIGWNSVNNIDYWNGLIDEVRIWNRSLSSQEIYQQYISNLQKFNSTQWYLYVNQSKNSTSGLDYGTYTYQVFANNSNGNSNQTDIRNITFSSLSLSSVVLNFTSSNNLTTDNLTANPIGLTPANAKVIYNWYRNSSAVTVFNMPMDGGLLGLNSTCSNCLVRDYAKGLNGTLKGNISYNSTAGFDGKGAYEFNPSVSYGRIDTITTTPPITGSNPFTITTWVRSNRIASGIQTIASWGNSATSAGAYFRVLSSGYLNLNLYAGCTFISNTNSLLNNTWHFVAVSYNGSTTTLYKDGSFVNSSNGCVFNIQTGKPLMIGVVNYDISDGWNGTIDEFIMWNKSLSLQQIQGLYNSYLQNKSNNIMVSQELAAGDAWSVEAYPNDNSADGSKALSNDVAIAQQTSSSNCINLSEASTYANKVRNTSTGYVVNGSISLCPGTYSRASTMIIVNATNITIDCNGSTLRGTAQASTYGIYNTKANLTVRNCLITNYDSGIYTTSFNGTFYNDSLISNSRGFECYSCYRNLIANSTFSNSSNSNIYFSDGENNTITNSTIKGARSKDIYYAGKSSNNWAYNNIINSSDSNFMQLPSSTQNKWNRTIISEKNIVGGNSLGGNFYANTLGTGASQTCTDADANGFCDEPLRLFNANNYDYLPLSGIGADSSPPSIIITSPSNNSFVNGNVSIFVSVSDNMGIRNVLYEYKNASINYTRMCNTTSSPYNCTWITLNYADSAAGYDLRATAYDYANNNASTLMHYTIDRTIPYSKDLNVIYPSGQSSVRSGQQVTLKVNISDSEFVGAGINTTIVDLKTISGTGNTTMNLESGSRLTGQWSLWNYNATISGAAEGENYARLYVYDNATPLNNVRKSDQFYVFVDNLPPTYDEIINTEVYNNEQVMLSINSYDNYKLNSIILSTNISGAWTNETAVSLNYSAYPSSFSKTVTNGTFGYKFYIFDDARNVNVTSISTFTTLGIRPQFTVQLVSPSDANITGSDNINITFRYYNGFAKNCSLYVNSLLNSTLLLPVNSTVLNFTIRVSDGSYSWRVECTDNATNQTYSSEARSFEADVTVPVISILYPIASNYSTLITSLNFTYLETNPVDCYYRLNIGSNTTIPGCSNITSASYSQGVNNLSIYIKDIMGNIGTSSVLFNLDSISPSLVLNTPSSNYYNDTASLINLTFNCSAIDNIALSNISLYITNYQNATFARNTTSAIRGTSNSSNWTLSLPNGNYTWNCLAYDSIGNYAWGINRTIKVNYSAPPAPMPAISLSLIDVTSINVTQNRIFNVTVNVSCSQANCGQINVTLDPSGIYVLQGGDNECNKSIKPILESAGYSVTCGVQEAAYTGSPDLSQYSAVILLKGTSYGSTMPQAGQSAIINYVKNGGGLVIFEWVTNAYAASPTGYNFSIISRSNGATKNETMSKYGNHEITNGLPDSWEAPTCGMNIGNPRAGITKVVSGSTSLTAVAANQTGRGRIVEFAMAPGYNSPGPNNCFNASSTSWNNNMTLLLKNAVAWVGATNKGVVPMNSGSPFWTSVRNPYNVSLNQNQSQIITWIVNASGNPDSTFAFYIYANKTSNMSIGAFTSKWNVTIVSEPNITLNVPADGRIEISGLSQDTTFNCSASSGHGLKNISLYITNNANQSFSINQSREIIGTSNLSSWSVNLVLGNYTWNCLAYDLQGNYVWAQSNRTIIVGISPSIGLSLVYPISSINVLQNNIFNVTVNISCLQSDCGQINVTLDPSGIYVLQGGDNECNKSIKPILESAGYSVTCGVQEAAYTGSPDLSQYSAVILLKGTSYGSTMPQAGQSAIINYVKNGGGLVIFEWVTNAYVASPTGYNFSIISRSNGATKNETMSKYGTHEITNGLPDSWEAPTCGMNIGNPRAGITKVVSGSTSLTAVAANQTGRGRIVEFAMAPGYNSPGPNNCFNASSTSWNNNMTLLLKNAVAWVGATNKGVVPMNSGSPFWTNIRNPYNISLNNGQSELITWYVNATGNTNSTFTFYVYANKTSNMQISNMTARWNVTIGSNSQTTISFVSPTTNAGTLSQSNIAASVYAQSSSFSNLTIYIYNSTGLRNSTTVSTASYSINYTGLPDGIYYLNATVRDSLGRINNTETRTILLDSTKPIIAILSPEDNYNSTLQDRNFTFIVNDAGISNCSLYTDQEGFVNYVLRNYNSTVQNNVNTTLNMSGLSNRKHLWYIKCIDQAGNINSTSTEALTIDTQVPIISVISPQDNSTAGSLIYINTNISDQLTYIRNAWYMILNASNPGQVLATGSLNESSNYDAIWNTSTYGEIEMNLTLAIYANDSLGNIANRNMSVMLDNVKPTIQLVEPPLSIKYYKANFSMSIIVQDLTLNYTYYNISRGNTIQFNSSSYATSTIQHIWEDNVNVSGMSDGLYNITLFGKDTAGNSRTASTLFIVDKTAPSITLNSPSNLFINESRVLFNISTLDNVSTEFSCTFTVDSSSVPVTCFNGSYCSYSFSDFTDGRYNYNVSCSDNSSNTRIISGNFTIDTIPPIISYVSPSSQGNISQNSIAINVSGTEANIDTIRILLYNSTGSLINSTQASTNSLFINFTGLADGIYYYNATINDSSGHSSYTETRAIIVDRTYPSARIGINSTTLEIGVDSVKINWSAADSNLQSVNFRISNPYELDIYTSSTSLGEVNLTSLNLTVSGIYNVYLTITDNSGNINSSSITFTVGDTTAPRIEVIDALNGTYSQNWISVNVTATDYSLSNVKIAVYNSSMDLMYDGVSFVSPYFINYTGLADGVYYYNATACDSTRCNTTLLYTVTLDTVVDSLTFEEPTFSAFVTSSSQNSIPVNVSTTESHLDRIIVYLYNSTGLVNLSEGVSSPFFVNFTNLPDGTYYFNVTANDTLGNRVSTETRTISIDGASPIITILSPVSITYGSGTILINVSSNEALSSCIYSTDEWGTSSSLEEANATNYYTLFSLSDGAYTLKLVCYDISNVNSTLNVSFVVHAQPPVTSLGYPEDYYSNASPESVSLELNCSAADTIGLANISLYITDNSNSSFALNQTRAVSGTSNSSSWTINLPVGNYTWNCLAYDSAGLYDWGNNRTIMIRYVPPPDLTAPVFNSIANQTVEYGTSLAYLISASDAGGIGCFTVNHTSIFAIDCAGNLQNITPLSLNTYWINITVNDTSGNTNSAIIWINVSDSLPPAFTGIHNITLEYHSSLLYNINATDRDGISCFYVNDTNNFNVDCSGNLQNITSLGAGVYWLSISVNDTTGNTNTKTIWINVTDTIKPVFTAISSQIVEYETAFIYDINATDENGISCFTVNNTNSFKIDCSGLLENNTRLGVGLYWLNISVNDTFGNRNSTLMYVNVSSTIIPFVEFVSPTLASGGYSRSSVPVRVNFRSAVNVTVNLYKSGLLVSSVSSSTSPLATTFTGLSEGVYKLNATATSIVGRQNNTETRTITLDSTAPLITLNAPIDNYNTTNSTLSFNFTSTDNYDVFYSCSLYLDNIFNYIEAASNTHVATGDSIILSTSDLNERTYSWYINCSDSLMNSRISEVRRFTIDNTAPEIELNTPLNRSYVGYNVYIMTDIHDSGIGIGAASYEIRNASDLNQVHDSGSLTEGNGWDEVWDSFADIGNVSSEEVVLIITATDTVGNANSVNISFTVDNINPSIQSIMPPEAGIYVNNNFTLNITVQDNTGLNYSEFNITALTDPVRGQSNSTLFTESSVTMYYWYDLVNLSDYPDGNNSLEIFAQDHTIINTRSLDIWFIIDRTPPAVTLNYPTNGYKTNETSLLFSWTAVDNISSIMLCNLTVNGYTYASNIQTQNNTPTTYRVNGMKWASYSWNVTCIDDAGNPSNATTKLFIPDFVDDDGDEVHNYDDRCIGNASNISDSGISSLGLEIGGSTNITTFNDTLEVVFSDGSAPVLNFSFNFTESVLEMKNITITKGENYIIINLSGQLQAEFNKTVYITDNSFTGICAKDADVSSPSEVSDGCDRSDETNFTSCINNSLGVEINGIRCTDLGTIIKFDNLRYSAIKGSVEESSNPPSGGGGKHTEVICVPIWRCTDWSDCIGGKKIRTCVDMNECGEETATELSCISPQEEKQENNNVVNIEQKEQSNEENKKVEEKVSEQKASSNETKILDKGVVVDKKVRTIGKTVIAGIIIAMLGILGLTLIPIFKRRKKDPKEILKEYIIKHLHQGHHIDTILHHVRKAGWDNELIDEVLAEIYSEHPHIKNKI